MNGRKRKSKYALGIEFVRYRFEVLNHSPDKIEEEAHDTFTWIKKTSSDYITRQWKKGLDEALSHLKEFGVPIGFDR